MVKRRIVIDNAVGETRAAVYEGQSIVEFHTRRWSDASRPHLGDEFIAQVKSVDKSLAAAFLDLGQTHQGFLKFTDAPNAPRFQEGQYVQVLITREMGQDKAHIVKYLGPATTKSAGPFSSRSLEESLSERYGGQAAIDYARVTQLYDAVEPTLGLTGGGDIAIEQTRALLAIDVDRGAARSGYDVSLEAASVIPRQLRLRGLGGLVVIDFPNLRQKKQRDSLQAKLMDSFAGDPAHVKLAPMSRFGAVELTRQKTSQSLDEIVLSTNGNFTTESRAMMALQRLEGEAKHNPGAKLDLFVEDDVFEWLESDPIAWNDAMQSKIGARFTLKRGHSLDVKRDR